MSHLILAEVTASVSELKKNPMGTVAAGEGVPVAILNRNAPVPRRSVWKFGLSPLLGGGVRWSLWAADGLWVDAWSTRRVVHPAIHR